MTYKVLVMPSAHQDLEEYVDYIATDSKRHAALWLRGAWEKIFSLSERPKRFSVIDESEVLGVELRDMIHHSHRIVYRVDDTAWAVEILRVWHMARRAITSRDL